MAQYDIPILQENASGKLVQSLLTASATRQGIATNPSTRSPELFAAACAGMVREANVTTTTFSGASTWTKYVHFNTDVVSVGATADHANDQITINEAGIYVVSFCLTLTGTLADDIEAAVMSAAGTIVLPGTRVGNLLGGTGAHQLAGTTVASIAAATVLALWVRNNTNTNAIIGTYASLHVLQKV